MNKNGQSQLLMKAYVHMILAHVFTEMPMIDKNAIGSDDLIYSSVAYVAKNYGSQITLFLTSCFDAGMIVLRVTRLICILS